MLNYSITPLWNGSFTISINGRSLRVKQSEASQFANDLLIALNGGGQRRNYFSDTLPNDSDLTRCIEMDPYQFCDTDDVITNDEIVQSLEKMIDRASSIYER